MPGGSLQNQRTLRYSTQKKKKNVRIPDILRIRKEERGVIEKKGNLIKSLRTKIVGDKCEFLFMSSIANSDFSSSKEEH